jgi:hypothetical protein
MLSLMGGSAEELNSWWEQLSYQSPGMVMSGTILINTVFDFINVLDFL